MREQIQTNDAASPTNYFPPRIELRGSTGPVKA
jgi:hypothetical protein